MKNMKVMKIIHESVSSVSSVVKKNSLFLCVFVREMVLIVLFNESLIPRSGCPERPESPESVGKQKMFSVIMTEIDISFF